MRLKGLAWVAITFAMALQVGCSEDNGVTPSPFEATHEMVVVATSDYESGNLAVLTDRGDNVMTDLLAIHGDNGIAAHGEHLYVLEKYGRDNIIKLAADDISLSGVRYQYSVGNGANPHSMVFVSDRKAYVSRHDDTALWIVDPGAASEEGFKIGEVDLSAFADADGLPEMGPMALAADKLYVGCQRMDRDNAWAPLDAQLVIVDTGTDQVVGSIALSGGNPHAIVPSGGRLYVSCEGSPYDPTDGGIEVVDTATDAHLGVLVAEAELNANVGDVALRSDGKGYVIAGGYDEYWVPHYAVYPFDPSSGQVAEALAGAGSAAGLTLGGDGSLYVADRSTQQPGIYVYDAADSLIAGPISTGLPPYALVAVRIP